MDIDYNGAPTLSYVKHNDGVINADYIDTWATIVNGDWLHALDGNYAHQYLRAPYWFTGKDGSYVFSYIAEGINDQSHYYYYSQIYDPTTKSWSQPIANADPISSQQFNPDYANMYYDKTGANNNLFAIVETYWTGNGRYLFLAERHALQNQLK